MTDTTVYVPGKGPIRPSGAGDSSVRGAVKGFRPSAPVEEPSGDGLIVALSAVDGFTDPSVLKKPFYFQCGPLESMPQDYTWEWDDWLSIGSGYHSNPNAAGLATWAFETLLVDSDVKHSFTLIQSVDVLAMVKTLRAIGDTMKPFQLQFGQPDLWGTWDVVSGATLRSLHVEERAGEPDARYLTVSFTEFPDTPDIRPVPPPPHVTNKQGTGSASFAKKGIKATLDSSKLHPNQRTLAALAKYYYGSAASWRLIAKASGLTATGPNVDLTTTVGKKKPPAKIIVPDRPNAPKTPQAKKKGKN